MKAAAGRYDDRTGRDMVESPQICFLFIVSVNVLNLIFPLSHSKQDT